MAISVDLSEYWRIEERYAKAGYKMENVEIGFQLEELCPDFANQYDLLKPANGMFALQVKGVAIYFIKTHDAIRVGTYEDHAAVGGKEVIDRFIRDSSK